MKVTLYSIILRNFWLKFFSIGLATVIWLAIHYGIRDEIPLSLSIKKLLAQKDIRIPVSTVLGPDEWRTFKITPAEVLVTTVGDQKALENATAKTIKVYVDLTKFAGPASASEDVHVDVPPSIDVLEISPATVAVEQVKQ
jgi:hypothetical protein